MLEQHLEGGSVEFALVLVAWSGVFEDVILALGYKNIVVTLGANGAMGFDGAFHRQNAVAEKIVDTLGAGDAFLAVSSPFACARYSMADVMKIGNSAGAAKVGYIGHSRSVTRSELGLGN